MTIEKKVSIDENGDEYLEYCVEINGSMECFETVEEAEEALAEALEEARPKTPGMRMGPR